VRDDRRTSGGGGLREGFGGVLGEHRDNNVVTDLGFGLVGCCYVDEDVAGLKGDFGMVRVDDRRHGADCAVGVQDHGVDGRVPYYMQIS